MLVKRLVLSCWTAVIVAGALASAVQAQPAKLKEPLWTHAFDLACRKFGEADFTDTTQKFGVEAFKDNNDNFGVYISQVGSLAAVNSGFQGLNKEITKSKRPEFITGLDLPARKAGQKDFKSAKTHSMEVFLDGNTNCWIYITEKGFLAATPAKGGKNGGNNAPKLSHSIDLGVRKGGVKEWKDAVKFGVEVYLDTSTNNLVYICETGSIAVIPEDPASKVNGDGKDPEYLHGLDLKVRKHNEFTFGKDTKIFGVEVYRDGNNGNLVFISENGTLTVTPGPKTAPAPTPNVQDPILSHGMNMRCRKVGESEFSPATQAFGIEVFRDGNVGVMLYLAETGSIAGAKLP